MLEAPVKVVSAHTQKTGLIAERVARFEPPEPTEATRPSFAARQAPATTSPLPDDWRVRPRFRSVSDGFQASIATDGGTSLYGTGEVPGALERNGAVNEVWASQPFRIEEDGTAVPNYDEVTKSLYQAHPWVLAVRKDGTSFGALADTTYRLEIDLRDGIRFASAQPFSVIVIEGESPQTVVERLTSLTGRIALPPHWALGYHQCRFSYYPDAKVRALADELRRRAIPCDTIWIDIHYMDAYKVFTFDPERFPDPDATAAYLHARGFRSVWILDPAIKAEAGYSVYEEGLADDHFVREPHGQPYLGTTWPGEAAFPDFTRPETRAWWGDHVREFLEHDADGLWLDLNEPALILPPGAELPENLAHAGGGELPPGPHAKYHNVYGMLMAEATYDAVREARPDQRPFILSRSNYLGGDRCAATWTGDNVSSWSHLPWSVSMILNLGLSGQPFCGPDIGGFAGTASPDLFARWIGVGALLPFSRTHTGIKSVQEPWSFGAGVEAIARTSLERRYRLLPYLYTLFRDAAETGLPIARPVFFANPADPRLRAEDHAFLLGDGLLVGPQMTPRGDHDFEFPSGFSREVTLVGEDPSTEPAFPVLRIRDGAIVPLGAGGQNTEEAFSGPITLLVSLDAEGYAVGHLYEDAGDGFDHIDEGYLLTTFRARKRAEGVEVWVSHQEGRRVPANRETYVELCTDRGTVRAAGSLTRGAGPSAEGQGKILAIAGEAQ